MELGRFVHSIHNSDPASKIFSVGNEKAAYESGARMSLSRNWDTLPRIRKEGLWDIDTEMVCKYKHKLVRFAPTGGGYKATHENTAEVPVVIQARRCTRGTKASTSSEICFGYINQFKHLAIANNIKARGVV